MFGEGQDVDITGNCLVQSLRWSTIKLEEMKLILVAVGLIGVLLFASPTLSLLIKPPIGQQFAEIYILGSNHTFDNIPFNIKAGIQYSVYLGIVNNMDASSYYTYYVKLANETQLPSSTSGQPSSLSPLFESKVFLPPGQGFETPLTFQVNNATVANGVCNLNDISINGLDSQINKATSWNADKTGFYYNLFVELWIYNASSSGIEYNDRFVSMNLNMTT
jgi:hypothetical protein